MPIRHSSRNIKDVIGSVRLESGERSELEVGKGRWYSYTQRASEQGEEEESAAKAENEQPVR